MGTILVDMATGSFWKKAMIKTTIACFDAWDIIICVLFVYAKVYSSLSGECRHGLFIVAWKKTLFRYAPLGVQRYVGSRLGIVAERRVPYKKKTTTYFLKPINTDIYGTIIEQADL